MQVTHYAISYTLSNKVTYDLQACFVDELVTVPAGTEIYKHLESMYPDYRVYIENIAELTEADFWDGDGSVSE